MQKIIKYLSILFLTTLAILSAIFINTLARWFTESWNIIQELFK